MNTSSFLIYSIIYDILFFIKSLIQEFLEEISSPGSPYVITP